MGLFEKGVGLGRSGAPGTPRQDTSQNQNKIDWGHRVGRTYDPPKPVQTPRPVQVSTTKK